VEYCITAYTTYTAKISSIIVHSVTGYIEYVKTNLQDWKVSWFSVVRVY